MNLVRAINLITKTFVTMADNLVMSFVNCLFGAILTPLLKFLEANSS